MDFDAAQEEEEEEKKNTSRKRYLKTSKAGISQKEKRINRKIGHPVILCI